MLEFLYSCGRSLEPWNAFTVNGRSASLPELLNFCRRFRGNIRAGVIYRPSSNRNQPYSPRPEREKKQALSNKNKTKNDMASERIMNINERAK